MSTWQDWLTAVGFDVAETNHLMKPLEYRPWVNRIGALNDDDRAAVHRLLLDADEPAVDFFEIEYADGDVVSFGSLKGLICGVRR
jgi:hypothetical protein